MSSPRRKVTKKLFSPSPARKSSRKKTPTPKKKSTKKKTPVSKKKSTKKKTPSKSTPKKPSSKKATPSKSASKKSSSKKATPSKSASKSASVNLRRSPRNAASTPTPKKSPKKSSTKKKSKKKPKKFAALNKQNVFFGLLSVVCGLVHYGYLPNYYNEIISMAATCASVFIICPILTTTEHAITCAGAGKDVCSSIKDKCLSFKNKPVKFIKSKSFFWTFLALSVPKVILKQAGAATSIYIDLVSIGIFFGLNFKKHMTHLKDVSRAKINYKTNIAFVLRDILGMCVVYMKTICCENVFGGYDFGLAPHVVISSVVIAVHIFGVKASVKPKSSYKGFVSCKDFFTLVAITVSFVLYPFWPIQGYIATYTTTILSFVCSIVEFVMSYVLAVINAVMRFVGL